MKRSEALKIIQGELERYGLDPLVSDIWASGLLGKIQVGIGMLPPHVDINLKIKNGEIEQEWDANWEPEDDN